MKIAILSYEKPAALKRLLHSIESGQSGQPADIYIFQDRHTNSHTCEEVQEATQSKLVKEVLLSPNQIGLRNNMLRVFQWCATINEPIVVLEDDLWLAPGALHYAAEALSFYRNVPEIGMISLYHQHYTGGTEFPNLPLTDGYDSYFMQFASSSGFIITPETAASLLSYSDFENDYISRNLPDYMKSWPLSSWKKIFNAWLIDHQKTVVYPRISYTTNFGDPGTNHPRPSHHFQSPVSLETGPKPAFCLPSQSRANYDIFMEWIPGAQDDAWKDTCFDLHGLKPLSAIDKPRVVTLKQTERPIQSFGRALKPQELNILYQIPGNDFHLMDSSFFEHAILPGNHWEQSADYFYIFTSGRKLLGYLKRRLFNSQR